MSNCCPSKKNETEVKKGFSLKRVDWVLWVGVTGVTIGLLGHFFGSSLGERSAEFNHHVFDFMKEMWPGLLLGMFFVGLIGSLPRALVMKVIGEKAGFSGILRTTIAGVLFDLCSHGILMIGAKLYKKGASLGQTMSFLIASPWNSISLTIILMSLVGVKLTLIFMLSSMIIALVSGVIFDFLVGKGVLPDNPNRLELGEDKEEESQLSFVQKFINEAKSGTRIIVKWLFLGVVIASLLKVFLDVSEYQTYFGATALGMGLTFIFSTVLEVCSEGTTPVAADIIRLSGAKGNGFLFLMNGVSTDYTEIMILKETTSSWKIALFLPLVTIPQILIFAVLMNILL